MVVVVQNDHAPEEDVDALLRIVDPHNVKRMTYSQIVLLLSNQLVPARPATALSHEKDESNQDLDEGFNKQFAAAIQQEDKLIPILERFYQHQMEKYQDFNSSVTAPMIDGMRAAF